MHLQRLFLKMMLGLLGASAAAGVLAIFLSTRVMGRVAATALVGAIATALAMSVSRLLDDEKKRPAGLIGLGAIVVSFVLALGAIWVEVAGPSWDLDWRLGITALLTCVAGLVASALVHRIHGPSAWLAARVAVATDVIGFGLLGAGLWDGGLGEKVAQTGGFVLASGPAAAVALIGVGREGRAWRWVGVLGALAALGLGLVGTWFRMSGDPGPYVTAISIAVVVAHAIVVMRVPLAEGAGWARGVAIGSTAAAGACVSLMALSESFGGGESESLGRVAGALGIVSACSTIAIVVLYRLHRRPAGTSAEVTAITGVHLVCPHCGRKRAAPLGESACEACGLLITVKVREPRCARCDYPLLDLPSGVCPECGTARGAGEP